MQCSKNQQVWDTFTHSSNTVKTECWDKWYTHHYHGWGDHFHSTSYTHCTCTHNVLLYPYSLWITLNKNTQKVVFSCSDLSMPNPEASTTNTILCFDYRWEATFLLSTVNEVGHGFGLPRRETDGDLSSRIPRFFWTSVYSSVNNHTFSHNNHTLPCAVAQGCSCAKLRLSTALLNGSVSWSLTEMGKENWWEHKTERDEERHAHTRRLGWMTAIPSTNSAFYIVRTIVFQTSFHLLGKLLAYPTLLP